MRADSDSVFVAVKLFEKLGTPLVVGLAVALEDAAADRVGENVPDEEVVEVTVDTDEQEFVPVIVAVISADAEEELVTCGLLLWIEDELALGVKEFFAETVLLIKADAEEDTVLDSVFSAFVAVMPTDGVDEVVTEADDVSDDMRVANDDSMAEAVLRLDPDAKDDDELVTDTVVVEEAVVVGVTVDRAVPLLLVEEEGVDETVAVTVRMLLTVIDPDAVDDDENCDDTVDEPVIRGVIVDVSDPNDVSDAVGEIVLTAVTVAVLGPTAE